MDFLGRFRTRKRHAKAPISMMEPASSPTGSRAALLGLPAELRLSIYQHVFETSSPIFLYMFTGDLIADTEVKDHFRSAAPSRYYQRFRGPFGLLSVCQQMRKEAEEVFYDLTLFVIGSPIQRLLVRRDSYYKGADPMPNGIVPVLILRRIRHLLLITDLRGRPQSQPRFRVGDLRFLQSMTSLRDFRLVFTNPAAFFDYYYNDPLPVRTVVESIPARTHIKLGCEPNTSCSEPYEEPRDAIFDLVTYRGVVPNELVINGYARVREAIDKLAQRQGILSGSRVDHSFFANERCREGKDCTNSRIEKPRPRGRWRMY